MNQRQTERERQYNESETDWERDSKMNQRERQYNESETVQ